ncbi:MAG TPA: mechanosensitive ion channel domain-containing protein [Flavobacteriaceae bacterium]|nr:mechanosensitive ion channel domain-containing protein [Flavobacteriaceae bacterium]
MRNVSLSNNYFETYSQWIKNTLLNLGLSENLADGINILVHLIVYLGFLFLLAYILLKIFPRIINALSKYNKINFQQFLKDTRFSKDLAYIIPLLLISRLTSKLLVSYPSVSGILIVLLNTAIALFFLSLIGSLLKGVENYLRSKPNLKDKPLQSYTQVLTIFVWGIGLIALINYIVGGTLITLAALGTASAVLLLIFKDTILGFVASIQISVNDIVRIGDWIEFNKYGADGFVTNISLVTVTIENWNKTYSTVPTYSLISESFKNWRGIYDNEGRQIKRAIYIKQNSIRFLNADDLERLKKIERVSSYIDHRQLDIDRNNKAINADKSVVVNGRNQTNIGVFKKYIDTYLKEQTSLNFDLLCLVRNLAPTEYGVPLEIYCFSKRTAFIEYEAIQGHIFDHITAAAPHFDLEIFEAPSGKDLTKLSEKE